MGIQPTASKTALLLQCTRPFADDTEVARDDPGEAALYGTAFHTRIYERFFPVETPNPLNPTCGGLHNHVTAAYKALKRWMRPTGNPFGERFKVVSGEQPLATRFRPRPLSRPTTLDTPTHTYQLFDATDKYPREMGGTPDLILRGVKSKRLVVLDHKTGTWGQGFSTPSTSPQMLTLAAQTGASIVAILHAPRDMPPTIYADELPADAIGNHAKQLHRQLSMVGDGHLRPGPECRRCPARTDCPAFSASLMRSTGKMVKAVIGGDILSRSAVSLGEFHQMLGQLDALMKRAREELKQRVRDGEVIERPDGKVLQLVTYNVERLSKSSIIKQLGSSAGQEVIDKLRDAGAMTEADEERMVAK